MFRKVKEATGHSLRTWRDSSRHQTQCPGSEPFHCISNFQIRGINKTSAANEYIWGLQSCNLSNFREKATQQMSVLMKPEAKLQVSTVWNCFATDNNGPRLDWYKHVFLAMLDELFSKGNKTSLLSWNGAARCRCVARMAVMELTNAVSGSAARVEHSKHAERWQPQWGVPLPHSYPLSHSSLHRPRVSGTGSPRGAPLQVARQIHWGFGLRRWRWILKINQMYMSQSDDKSLRSSQQLRVWPKPQEVKQNNPRRNQSSGCFDTSRRAPRRTAPTAQAH